MLIIASSRGFMVALLSLVAGVVAVFTGGAFGASKAVAIGILAVGATAWLLGRHEPERNRACSLFFLPLRFWAAPVLVAGVLFLFVPNKPKTPENRKLDDIEARLRSDVASGSSGGAAEKAAGYQKAIVGFEKLSGIEGKVSVYLDLDSSDLREVRKAALYVESFNLKKYGDEHKKALVSVCVKMMRADFPEAAVHVAARGPFLWGVRGSSPSAGAEPVMVVDSDEPHF
jgi:hypothetical protein